MMKMSLNQRLISYCYFILINSLLAIIISCRYLLSYNNYPLDTSTIFFWFSNHISYILLISCLVGIIGCLGFVFKTVFKQRLFQSIIVALYFIILFIDTDNYIRSKAHLSIINFPIYFVKTIFYIKNRPWLVFSILMAPLLIYFEYFLIKWISKQSWISNKKPLITIFIASFISIVLAKSVFYISLSNYKKQTVTNLTSYIPNFNIGEKSDKNLLQKTIYAIKFSLKYSKMLCATTTEEKCNKIYEYKLWGKGAGLYSGSGAALDNNLTLRNNLVEIVKDYNIKSIFDGACGDFYWMNLVLPQLNLDKYIGGDVASYIINENKKNYSYDNVEFKQMDITTDKLPDVDLMIVRDTLGLLSYADIKLFLNNFYQSNIKYLLVTTCKNENGHFNNKNVITGEYRPIDLFDKPFYFDRTKVKITIADCNGGARTMILLNREDVPATF